jgi:dTDP-4-amino-4,6-dideoxygalactose transaminase
MTPIPFLDLPAQDAGLRDDVLRLFAQVCGSGRFILGPLVAEFERAFARYCEVEHCVAVNSGTSALHLALLGLGVGPGDEVVTTPMTFVATAWAISYVGATPVFVDIDPVSRTMDPDAVARAIAPRTRAVMPVHLYGQPADLTPILDVAAAHGVPVVEDAAQAHGARYRGRRVGGLGRVGCFSFYPGKNLGAYGEGGALVTNDGDLAERVRRLRDHGQRRRYDHETVGFNYRMDALQGAVLGVKLASLDGWNASRRRLAARYRESLADVPGVTGPTEFADRESVYHLYVIETDDRDALARRLGEAGIETGLHYPTPVHLQPAYRHLNLGPGAFPHAERLARRCLSLPLFPTMTDAQVTRVAGAVRAHCRRGRAQSAAP